ncbi:hypothetical protein C8J56DRAFT_799871 [Mycena floridula]|nr:hypothetical protein C8J56DRAFT_799871 [Mycena floridula]
MQDEIVVLSSSPPVASSSKLKKPKKNDSDDEEDLGGFANAFSEEDERLARRLAQEEEESFQALMDNIDSKEDGIVFSVVVNVENNTLEDGSPAHPDDLDRFAPWKALCEKSGQKVKKFHWFVNYELEKRFDQARDKLAAIMGKYPPEVQLFHGTSAMNIDSILKGGFKIGGVNGHPISHGTSMGFGTYLATDAATSLSYNPQKIFACRVVPGRTTNTPIMQPPPSIHVGAERYDSYHTPGVYVHRYPSLILPCYVSCLHRICFTILIFPDD